MKFSKSTEKRINYSIEELKKHGYNPIACTVMMCEDTFIFKTKSECIKAFGEFEIENKYNCEETLCGWWYNLDEFKRVIIDHVGKYSYKPILKIINKDYKLEDFGYCEEDSNIHEI